MSENNERLNWLIQRQKGIGGSDIGALLGLSKWKTAFDIFIDKTEQITDEGEESEIIYWGNQFEDVVAKEFTKRTGKKVRKDKTHYRHREHEFMVANIDRRVVGENAILECKTTSAYNAKEWNEDEIPASYLLQVQHYMAVTGAEKAYIACLIGGQKFVWKEVKKDYELIKIIENACVEFWTNHILTGIAPALDGSTRASEYLKDRYKDSNGETKALESRYLEIIEQYNKSKELLKDVETECKEYENMLKNELAEYESGEIKQYKVLWKSFNSNRIDSNLLKSKYPDIYKEVLKTTQARKFSIKEMRE